MPTTTMAGPGTSPCGRASSSNRAASTATVVGQRDSPVDGAPHSGSAVRSPIASGGVSAGSSLSGHPR